MLVATAHIDKALESLLLAFFRSRSDMGEKKLNCLFDFQKQQNPIFGSFGAKIMTAHAIGLIDAGVAVSLDAIRDLRNKFAHHPGRVSIGQFRLPPFPQSSFGKEPLKAVGKMMEVLTEFAASLRAPRLSKARVDFMQTAAMVHGIIKIFEDSLKRGELRFQLHTSD